MAGYGYPNHPFLPNHQQPLHHPQPTTPYGHNMLNYTSAPQLWSPPMAHPLPPVPPVPPVPMNNNNNNNNSSSSNNNNLFYKTRHCKKYRETGECPYGKSCIFAHGDEELRKPPGNLGLCHKFLRDGYCPYGNTCTYLHQQPGKVHAVPATSAIGDGASASYQTIAPFYDPLLHYNHLYYQQQAQPETEVENMGGDYPVETDQRNIAAEEALRVLPNSTENMGGDDDHVENGQRNIAAEEALRILPNSTVSSSTMDVYASPRNEENNNERNRDVKRNKRFPIGKKIITIYADWIDEC